MDEAKIRRVEINFGAAVNLPDGWERALDGLVDMVCQQYKRENPTRTMWPDGHGCKPQWSKADAAFLGKTASPTAPDSGEPTWDDSVYCIDVTEQEDYHGDNPLNPDREGLRAAAHKEAKARKEAKAHRQSAKRNWPGAVGISRDAESPKSLLIAFDREPTDDEMRALHDGLRAA